MKTEEIIERIKERNEQVFLTIGYRWKYPTTMDVPMAPEEAIKFLEEKGKSYALFELEDRNGKLHLNGYTANDMW